MGDFWTPEPIWEGEDVYVIGGGDSLRTFNWDLLRDRRTVGCNGAYTLGSGVCDVLVFGDSMWWDAEKENLEGYGGTVVTACPRLFHKLPPWVRQMKRKSDGLGIGDTLAWNGNTGSLALNLALLLGAHRVFLLGFDMTLGSTKRPIKIKNRVRMSLPANWHDRRHEPENPHVYKKFMRGFDKIAGVLPAYFPGREVWNVTEGSRMTCFPMVSLRGHFGEKVVRV